MSYPKDIPSRLRSKVCIYILRSKILQASATYRRQREELPASLLPSEITPCQSQSFTLSYPSNLLTSNTLNLNTITMSLITINVYKNKFRSDVSLVDINNNIDFLHTKVDSIISLINTNVMPTLAELSNQVDNLQAVLDQEQEQIALVIEGLNQVNENLQALVNDGGTAEERQALSDKLTALTADLASTIPDDVDPDEDEDDTDGDL